MLEAVPDESADKLLESIEKNPPEAEPLPADPVMRAVILEEGIAMMLKEAAKGMYSIHEENKMRAAKPRGPEGKGWQFPIVLLAGIEAGFIAPQVRGLVKLGRDPEVWKKLRTPQRSLVNVWEAALPVIEKAWDDREIGDDTNPVAVSRIEDFIEKTLMALNRSEKLFNRIARNRARRLGPKAAAMARFHASSLHVAVRKRQQAAIQSIMKEGASNGEAEGTDRTTEA